MEKLRDSDDSKLGLAPPLSSDTPAYDADPYDTVAIEFCEEPTSVNIPAPQPFGPFELLELLGRGGMGVVYKARQRSPHRLVAIKITSAGSLTQNSDAQRFRNETELVARLDHPHIVPIYEVGKCGDSLYFSMKLIDGGDLSQHINHFRNRPRDAAAVMAVVARAIHHAHERGILHRDLKPSNILLDAQGQPHVTDFGLARPLDLTPQEATEFGLTQSGMLIGTPSYMAPEQARSKGRMLTTAVDVYGLGAVLYTLMSGWPPFRGPTPLDTLLLVGDSEPTPPRQLNPAVDRDLETICLKCMHREPARRYASAQEVAEDLERWLAGEPILARSSGVLERLWRRCRRQPALALLSLLSVTLLIALLIGQSAAVVLLRDAQARTRQQHFHAQHQARLAIEREATARRLLYVADINQAWRAFESSDLKRMQELLDRQLPGPDQEDLRGFEWSYLQQLAQTRALVQSRQLHEKQIFGVASSPHGDAFATTSEDRRVVMWSATSDKTVFELTGFANDANAVVFTPNGETLLACGEDGSIWSCDARTGAHAKKLYQSPSQTPIPQLAISPDGAMLVAACWDGVLRRFTYPSMEPLPDLRAHSHQAESVQFTPDGETLISAGRDGTIKLWNAATRSVFQTIYCHGGVKSLAIAQTAPLGAAGCFDQSVIIFNYRTGEVVRRLTGHTLRVLSVAISDDDLYVAASDESGSIRIWELTTGRLIDLIPGERHAIWSLCFARGVSTQPTILAGDSQGKLHRLTVGASPWPRRLIHSDSIVTQALFLPDKRTLAGLTFPGGDVPLVDLERGSMGKVILPAEQAKAATFDVNAEYWATGGSDGKVQCWRFGESKPLWTVAAHPSWVHSIAILPDNRTVMSFHATDSVKFWDLRTGKLVGEVSEPHTSTVSCALAPDAQSAAISFANGDVALIDCQTRRIKRYMEPRRSHAGEPMTFSPDGEQLAIGRGNAVHLVQVEGEPRLRVLLSHAQKVRAMAFSPDGKTLASAAGESAIHLWSVALGQELFTLQGTDHNVFVTFSPDGRALFACGHNRLNQGEVFAWDAVAPLASSQ
jgi:WD40 repeat protein/serine/threonine protein kinase